MRNLCSLSLFALLAGGCALFSSAPAATGDPVYHPFTTRKMYQLTGDFDRPLQRPTASLTGTQAKLNATDLGSSFEHKGILYFMFGDTWGRSVRDLDTYATTTATRAEDLVIHVPLADDGMYQVITVTGIYQGGMAVVSGGISVNGNIYIVHTTDWYGPTYSMERSVMARSTDDGRTWTLLYDLSADVNHDMSNTHFTNVSMAEINAEDYPGLLPWSTGKVVLIWGSGAYRQSNVYLAAVSSASIENKAALRYFAGMNGSAPVWNSLESNAVPLFNQPQVGEFSVAWIPQVARWMMLYNASSPRGITMRTAQQPWGPWSGGSVLMGPFTDDAYGIYLHIPWAAAHVDAFHDSGRADEWGGEYGPYIIPRFTTGDATRCLIYYTMSTWNPYQCVVMRSEIGAPVAPESSQTTTQTIMPGDAQWQMTSSDFFVNTTHNSQSYITTLTAAGTSAKGCMWRWLPRETTNRALQFSVYGGLAEVMVLSGGGDIPVNGETADSLYPRIKSGEFGEVVFCTWGHRSDTIDVNVNWDLRPFDRANLKVVIIDQRSGSPWGYVAVGPMTLTQTAPPSSVPEWETMQK